MIRRSYILLIVFSLLVACRPAVPSGVLSEGDMADILYDIHLAQAMYESSDVLHDGRDVVALRSAVLKKHDVTPEEFERSYQFYCSHADRMHDIYSELSERIRENVIAAGGKIQGIETEEADTANVWNQEPSAILMDQPPYNKVTFSVLPDSTFRLGDRINLQYDLQTVAPDAACDIMACLNIFYPNDSIANKNTQISSNGRGVLSLNSDSTTPLSKITGYFLLMPRAAGGAECLRTPFRLAVLRNIKLLHLHEQGTGTVKEEKPSADQE